LLATACTINLQDIWGIIIVAIVITVSEHGLRTERGLFSNWAKLDSVKILLQPLHCLCLVPELMILTSLRQKLVVCTTFCYGAILEHDDLVGMLYR
jgi:hypothetical protein